MNKIGSNAQYENITDNMEQDLNSMLPVLCKAPSQRTQQEIEQIAEMLQQLPLFKSMSKDLPYNTLEKCALSFRYEFKSQNSYAVQYGEKADRFYIILKGTIGVLVPHRHEQKTVMKEILEMSDGASFGELGLNENKTRAASILCKEDTHLMYLEKDAYLDFFVKYIRQKQRSIIDTLKHNSMFAGFSNIFLVKLSYFFNEDRITRGNDVFKEGNPANLIYIVKEGEFSLRKKIDIGASKKKEKKFCIKKNNARDSEVAILSRGSFCNEEDLLNDKYMFSCKCVSMNGIVLSIKKTDLIHKIVGKDSEYTMKSLSLKKLLRKQQTNNIWNVQNGISVDVSKGNRARVRDTPKTSSQLQKRNDNKNDLFSNKGNRLRIPKRKIDLSPSFVPKVSKSQSLLKYYKKTVRCNPIFTTQHSPNSLSPRNNSSFLKEEYLTRGFIPNGNSIAWKHKLCRYAI